MLAINNIKKHSAGFLRIKSDPLATKTINLLMRDGKRSKAEKVLFKALQALDKIYPGQAIHIFYLAIISAKQDIGVRLKPKSKKGRQKQSYNVYIPRIISSDRGLSLGIRSILKVSREKSQISSLPFWKSLSHELLQASQNKGEVILKKYKVHGLAISNKRKAHFGFRR